MKPVLFKLLGRASDLVDVQPVIALFLGGAFLAVFLRAVFHPQLETGPEGRGGPFWAALTVNGEKRGTTPALLELPAGKNVIRLERTGFKTIEKQIKVASGRSAVLRIELVP